MTEITYDTRIGYSKGVLTPLYWAVMKFEQLALAVFRRGSTFRYRGSDLRYVLSMYNRTWANERCVELAIAYDALESAPGKRVLEVGNVLSWYGVTGHEVVDKYEQADGVRNIDILELGDEEKFDLIVSISTLEHVGWDETPREPAKLLAAYERLVTALAPGGKLLVSVPVDWNAWLDDALANDKIPADRIDWLERTGRYCSWRECDKPTALAKNFGSPYGNANALAILTGEGSDD
ncbi:MAG: hypothetical protein JHD02_01835 [Thermoleophilaceae bacterium]|nr:hypothetical protein [Thermoleophilaceae bacterium]